MNFSTKSKPSVSLLTDVVVTCHSKRHCSFDSFYSAVAAGKYKSLLLVVRSTDPTLSVPVTIDSIHEVCEGKKSEMFRRYADNRFDPNCCFSIYFGRRVKSLDLVSNNAEEVRTWVTGLKYLMAGISDEDSLARRQRTRDQYPFITVPPSRVGLLSHSIINTSSHANRINSFSTLWKLSKVLWRNISQYVAKNIMFKLFLIIARD